MFTGLIEGQGRIVSLSPSGTARRLAVRAGRLARGVKRGDSVAVDGCCLTALSAARAGVLRFDVVGETWRLTTLSLRKPGDPVNLERPLRWGQRLGGHLVQGHVDGTSRVLSPGPRLRVRLPAALARQVVRKGSISLDGVSLTVAAKRGTVVEVALIPETLRKTTLGLRRPGDLLNVETDLLLRKRRPRLPRRPTRGRPGRPRGSRRPAGSRPAGRS